MRVAVAVALTATIGVGLGGQAPPPPRPSGLIVFSGDPTNDGPWYSQLLVADLDAGTVRQLTRRAGGGYNPSWSPDGKQVAFERSSDGPCRSPACTRIFLIDADGTRRRAFTPANQRCQMPAWSPDGKWIAYVRWRPSGETEIRSSIWIRSVDGRNVRRLTFAAKAFDWRPVWSPDSTRIVFSRDMGRASENYVVRTDGTGLHRLRGNRSTSIQSWSSDGKRLAGDQVFGRWNNNFRVVVANADGSGERLLLRGGSGPVWSPDDRFIAFVPDDQDISRGWVSVVRADGRGRRRLFTGSFAEPVHLDWIARPAGGG
jgi:Tol biopolymer transport system component